MGIKNLNKYIKQKCSKCIYPINLSKLDGKTITVDTSIYLYKFNKNNELIEKMFQMISIFKMNNITPIFIFDGKPPKEKKELLKQRNNEKIKAKEEFDELVKNLENNQELSFEEEKEIREEMNNLKKKFIRIKKQDVKNVKKLMDIMGVQYIQSKGESDKLCVKLVLENIAYGCLSEDMDMFVYGCPRVFRYLSLINSNVVLYNFKSILKKLNLNHNEFTKICIVTGTDYSCGEKTFNIEYVINRYKKYRKFYTKHYDVYNIEKLQTEHNIPSFYKEFQKRINYTEEELNNIENMFNLLNDNVIIDDLSHIVYKNKETNLTELKEFLKEYGFVFV